MKRLRHRFQYHLMEYAFNEILLVKFIMRYYVFEPQPYLVQKGTALLTKIIEAIIQTNPQIRNLKDVNKNQIIDSILSEFHYRLGGLDQCKAAFGNFCQNQLTQNQIQYSEAEKKDILRSQCQKILQNHEIIKIIDPLKDLLQKLSFYLEQTQQIIKINDEQITNRKIDYYKDVFGFGQPNEIPSKKNKKQVQKGKNQKVKAKPKPFKPASKLRSKLEDSIITQADEQTYSPSEKTSKTTKVSLGTSTFNQWTQKCQDQIFKVKFQYCQAKQENHNMILCYDELVSTSNKTEGNKIAHTTKPNNLQQKPSKSKQKGSNRRLF